jgi:putative ABC transport system permease protein
MLNAPLQDVRFAVRSLLRARGLAVAAILTLALGIGATTTMVSVVDAMVWRPPPFAEPDRLAIVSITRATPLNGLQRLRWSRPGIAALESAVSSFEAIASFTSASVSLAFEPPTSAYSSPIAREPEQIDGEIVSSEYFRALRVVPIAGRLLQPADNDESGRAGAQPVVLVSAQIWRRRFGADSSLVGHDVRINDVPLTVVGILPDGFSGLSGRADVWIPRSLAPRLTYSDYLTTPQHFINVVARLKDGVSLERANAEVAAIGPRFADAGSPEGTRWSAAARPLAEARVDLGARRSALALLAAAVCVLLIACVNVASLLLGRARTRAREIAIRLAIGSSRWRLVRHLLTEGAVLATVSGACGAVMAAWGTRALSNVAPPVVASARNDYAAISTFASPGLDFRVLGCAVVVTLAATLLFGLVPALDASNPDLVSALKQDERSGSRRTLGGLVVSEMALAVMLLAGAGLLIVGFTRIQNLRVGFDTSHVLTFWIRPPNSRYAPEDGPAVLERLLARIQQAPGVETAAVNRCTPFMGCARTTVFFPDRPADPLTAPVVGRHYVSADYFRTLRIPVRAGRALTSADRAGRRPVAVINETAARRFWPGESPIGRRVWFGSGTGFTSPDRAVEIVGVVGDVKYEAADQPTGPDFYTSYLQFAYPDTLVIVKTLGATDAAIASMRSAVAWVDASLPIFDVRSLDDRIDAAVARPRFNAALAAAFAATALLLTAVGVYGVFSYSVSTRLREIGIRLALGADGAQIRTLVLGEGLRLAVLGSSLGVVAAAAGARLIEGLMIGTGAADPFILVTAPLVMLGVAAAAVGIPARRASAVDPLMALRSE